MPRHAGFAAAIVLREQTLNDLVRVLHHANKIPHTLAGSNNVPLPGGGTGRLDANLFLDVPHIGCVAGERFALELRGWGPMSLTLPGVPTETRPVLLTTRVMVVPVLTLANASLTIGVNAWTALLDTLQIAPLSGGPFPGAIQTFLGTPQFRDLVQLAIRLQLSTLTGLAPPVNVSFLGGIANASNTTVTAKVLNGALAMGLDVSANGVTTSGNAAQLTDFREGLDLAMWTNPVAAPVAFAMVRTQVETTVSKQNATLDSFSMAIEEGHLRISGHATKSPGSVDFSMNAVPHLVRPGYHEEWDEEYGEHFVIDTPPRDELWFEMRDVNVDVHRDWWVYLLEALGGIITVGIGVAVVEAMVAMVRDNIVSGVVQQSNRSFAARTQEFLLQGTTEPMVRLRIERFESHTEGAFAGMTLRPQFPAASLDGPRAASVEDLVNGTFRYTVKLPFDAHPQDPQLQVRWIVRRMDTNAIVVNTEGQAGANLSFIADLRAPALMPCPRFSISCRVYRALGPTIADLFNESVTLTVVDRLDRSHPYVRWHHSVITPNVRVEADGTKTLLGYDTIARVSAIHRTAVPGRCKMVIRYSAKVGPGQPEYLDALPFPVNDLVARRAVVCDYCFFGGPTKTVPLVP